MNPWLAFGIGIVVGVVGLVLLSAAMLASERDQQQERTMWERARQEK